jgi:hypothetical protein
MGFRRARAEEDAVTVNATLPASLPLCCERRHGADGRSGLTRLITMKVLKHSDADTPDTVASLMRITARGAAQIHSQTSLWLDVAPMSAAALAAVGMLVAVYGAISRVPKHAGALYVQSSRTSSTPSVESGKVGAGHVIHSIA